MSSNIFLTCCLKLFLVNYGCGVEVHYRIKYLLFEICLLKFLLGTEKDNINLSHCKQFVIKPNPVKVSYKFSYLIKVQRPFATHDKI